jgi:hypothetical protein
VIENSPEQLSANNFYRLGPRFPFFLYGGVVFFFSLGFDLFGSGGSGLFGRFFLVVVFLAGAFLTAALVALAFFLAIFIRL